MRILCRESRPWLNSFISVLAGAAILFLSAGTDGVKHGAVELVNGILSYPEKPVLYLRNIIKLSGNRVLERDNLNERVEKLELKNLALEEALQRAGVKSPAPKGGYLRAVVTLRYPQEWWQELRIDKGAQEGVREGAAVASEGFLVGRVTRVSAHSSWVELITSSSFLIAAAVDQTRDLGVAAGDGMGHLRLLYIPEERNVRRGMSVSTSLMSDVIPPGLAIGTIIGIDEEKEGYKEMRLSAGAHLTQLYNVDVFMPSSGGAQR